MSAHILIVDDNLTNMKLAANVLEDTGYKVSKAADAVEAQALLASIAPDLILMDLSMPGMDGWEATRRLKADRRTRDIPVIALTGHALTGFSESAKLAGCDAFVTKPCLPDTLVEEVRRLLGGQNAKRDRRKGASHG